MLRQNAAFIILPLLASCMGPQAALPTPARQGPVDVTMPALPAPLATADRYAGDWSVDSLSAGEWHYSRAGGIASANFRGADGAVLVVIACGGSSISIGRTGAVPADAAVALRIRTTFALRFQHRLVGHEVEEGR